MAPFRPCSVALVLALRLAVAAWAQDTSVPAIVIELKWVEDKVELVSKKNVDAWVPKQLGVPQNEPMFLEVLSGEDNVIYAASLSNPLDADIEGESEEDRDARRKEGMLAYIPIPREPAPRRVTIYRRLAERGKTVRAKLLEVNL